MVPFHISKNRSNVFCVRSLVGCIFCTCSNTGSHNFYSIFGHLRRCLYRPFGWLSDYPIAPVSISCAGELHFNTGRFFICQFHIFSSTQNGILTSHQQNINIKNHNSIHLNRWTWGVQVRSLYIGIRSEWLSWRLIIFKQTVAKVRSE